MSVEPAQLSDRNILDFERPIIDLEKKISELRGLSTETVDFSAERSANTSFWRRRSRRSSSRATPRARTCSITSAS